MGANKNSNRQKCGNILINIKTIKNKNKHFTFHCAFCSTDCDQLKKFSKHLEEKHLDYFDDDLEDEENEVKCPIIQFEPEEIKVEEGIDIENFNEGYFKNQIIPSSTQAYKDPLDTEKSFKNKLKEDYVTTNVKSKHRESANKQDESLTVSIDNIDHNNTNWYQDADDNGENVKKPYRFRKDSSSDDFTDDSNDTDFEVENEFNASKILKRPKKEITKTNVNISSNTNRKKKRKRTIIEQILPTLIKEYKKYEILWQVNKIEFGVKNKKYEVYAKILEDLKIKQEVNITVEDINYHINYLNELYSKDKEQELKCKIEKKKFVPEYELYTQMSFLSESQGPIICAICNEILPKYYLYCQHMAQHNSTQPFKCPSCEIMFTNYHKYLIHKKRHLGIYNFHCDICGKGYLSKNDLEWHVTSHTGDKPYLCQICGTGFRARHGYDNHIRRHEERYRYECHICKRGFNQLHALNNHVKAHLNVRDIICKICGKGFVHNKYLKRHQLIHGDVKNYKCSECGKAFFQACGLRAHRKNHHS